MDGVISSHDWEQMPYFLAVARTGSLRSAGNILGATHGTVDRHIRALEMAYGVQLFRRSQGGLELTREGRALVPIAEDVEGLFVGARRRLQGLDNQESGLVRFSLTGTMAYDIVAPILAKFSNEFPQIDLQVRVRDQFDDINRLETDVSLRYAREVKDDVVARKLFPMALAPLASRKYLERHLPSSGEGGEGLQWIGWGETPRAAAIPAQDDFPLAEIKHSMADHVLQLSLLRQGVGMLNSLVYFTHIYPELVMVPGGNVRLENTPNLWILLHSDLRRTTRVRRFVDFLADELNRIKPQLQGKTA